MGEATTVVESNAATATTVIVTPSWVSDSYQYYAECDDLRYAGLPTGAGNLPTARATATDRVVWVVVAHHNASQRAQPLSSLDGLDYRRDRHVPLTELDGYRFAEGNRTD